MNILEEINGIEGIKKLFTRALNNNEKLLRTGLSSKPLVYLAGEEFAEDYMCKRRDSEIFLKSLRFSSNEIDLPKHRNYKSYNKEARIAPKEISMKSSIILWDDFVAVVDPIKISGTILQDNEYAVLMKNWFDFIWSKSS